MTVYLTIPSAGVRRLPVDTDDRRQREQASRILERAAVFVNARDLRDRRTR